MWEHGSKGDYAYSRGFWSDEYRMNALLRNYPKPVVSFVDGIVMGGGVGIASNCSHRCFSEKTLLAMPETGIGLLPDVGGTFILSRSPGRSGEFLGLTGTRIGVADAIYAGFADHFVPSADHAALKAELCKTGDVLVIGRYERDPMTAEAPEVAPMLADLLGEIDEIFDNSTPMAIVEDLQASKAEWAQAAAKAILRACPLSVGSTLIARYVYETGTRHGKRVQALGGAKNHMVVLPDADLDEVADAAVSAGFGSAGERCMAISVVVAVDPVGDSLVERIAARMAGLRTGDGRRGCDMGPLVTGAHRDKVASYVAAGVQAGASLVVDGREVVPDGDENGFWLGPTLFDHVEPGMPVYDEEIFGPVLSVVRAASYDEALALVNANPYGNGTAIFTGDGGAARRFQREVEVGMVGVNVPIPVPMAYYSFGGWKASLFGDTHAHGMEGVHFFTRGKVVTTRWPDPASRPGIDLGFPQHR